MTESFRIHTRHGFDQGLKIEFTPGGAPSVYISRRGTENWADKVPINDFEIDTVIAALQTMKRIIEGKNNS